MKKRLVLVVDDEQSVAETISEMIGKTGRYEAIIANSAGEAMEKIKENKGLLGVTRNKIQLILLDIRMPGLNGLEFAEKMYNEVDRRIGIIMVTAFNEDENWIDSVFAFDNVISFVRKPVDRDYLIALLDGYFKGDKEEIKKGAMVEFMRRDIGIRPEEKP